MASQSESDDEGWDDADWSEDASAAGGIQYVSLFCSKSFNSAEECFQHDSTAYDFDIRDFIAEVGRQNVHLCCRAVFAVVCLCPLIANARLAASA